MKLDHIGYLVRSIDHAINFFELQGFSLEKDIVEDENRKIRIAFINDGKARIELVEPNKLSVVAGKLKKGEVGAYHLCFNSTCPEEDYEVMRENGCKQIIQDEIAIALDGAYVSFWASPNIGLIELTYVKENNTNLGGKS